MINTTKLQEKISSQLLRLGRLEYDKLMNSRDRIIHQSDDQSVRLGFSGYAHQSGNDGDPYLMNFNLLGGLEEERFDESGSFAGEIDYLLKYDPLRQMEFTRNSVEIKKDWFADWVDKNIEQVVSDLIERNEARYQHSLMTEREESQENTDLIKDVIFFLIFGVIGAIGLGSLIGPFGYFLGFVFVGYAGKVLRNHMMP